MEAKRRMGHRMGHQRKGGNRGSVDRHRPRNAKTGRGTKNPSRTKTRARQAAGGKVVPISRQRRTVGPTGTPRVSSSSGEAQTVGHRRLWMVAAVFAVTGLLLGGRAVHISLTQDESYQAFADEQSGGEMLAAAPTRGSIVSADGRELATSLDVARVVATPYQIEDPHATAQKLAAVLGQEPARSLEEIESSLTKRDASGQLTGYSVVATGVRPETAAKVQDLGIEGITTAPDSIRVYPDGSL